MGRNILKMGENRALREEFGPKGSEVVGDWRQLLNEEPHKLCASLDIIRVIKSRKLR
jgi:hypothetical protein